MLHCRFSWRPNHQRKLNHTSGAHSLPKQAMYTHRPKVHSTSPKHQLTLGSTIENLSKCTSGQQRIANHKSTLNLPTQTSMTTMHAPRVETPSAQLVQQKNRKLNHPAEDRGMPQTRSRAAPDNRLHVQHEPVNTPTTQDWAQGSSTAACSTADWICGGGTNVMASKRWAWETETRCSAQAT